MEIDQPGNFICRFCKGWFTQAQHLRKHVQLIHTANPTTKNNRTCPICGTVFAKYEGYRTHLRHIHGQRNEGQIFAFKCFNDFFLWKTELEIRSSSNYTLNAAPKLLPSNEKIHVYQCEGNAANKKKKGSCRTIENCAAMICATESLKNHEIKVEYWNTHVGHIVPPEEEELNAAVVVEEDELNAAINSVQTSEEPTMHVMDMLNSIDQSIETGAEVFVTETMEDDNSLSPIPKKNQKNIFNIKKRKSSAIKTCKTPPIVQNFSFKKDPSKKKESSIYSLASVACGKISANKAFKSTDKNISKYQSSIRTNIPKNVASNSVCDLNNIVNSISELAEDDTTDHLDHIPKSSLRDTSIDGQLASSNPSPPVTNKKQIVYNWPVGKPLPTDWVISDPPPSGDKSSKNSTEKENISSISNKIIVPIGSETNKSKEEKSVKPKTSKASNPTSKTKSASKQASSASVAVPTNTTQTDQSSKPFSTPHSALTPQIMNSIQNFTPTPLVPSVLPAAQTYISVNNKLIPIVNTSFPPSLGSSVLLPILPKPPLGSILKTPTTTSKEIAASYQPPAVGVVKQNTPLAGTVPTLSNSFSGSPVILVPCTNNSAIPSILHPRSSTAIGSPLVLQSITPVTTASVNRSNMLMSSLLKTASAPISQQTVSSASTAKSILAGPVSSHNSTNLSKAVKVQKVSLPTANNSTSLLNKNINSVLNFSQPSQVSSVVLNTAPISSTPAINIPEMSRSGAQKPGSYLFESSGELYMLEPLDDELLMKESNTPLTSTPKKMSNLSMFDSFKKKPSPKKTGESVLRQKPGKVKNLTNQSSAESFSTVIGAGKKNILSPENNNSTSEEEMKSSLSDFKRSVLKETIDSNLNKSDITDLINQKTEMTIKIAPSQNAGEKEVSIFAKTPTDIRTKLPASGSSLLKYTPSLLTVKTVPSFSLHQSRPVTSTLNSFRNFTSSSLITSSALQSTPSFNGSASVLSSVKEVKESNASERSLLQETQNVEVKRNVTIKSVVQEKRSATDDDLEVMKKVKFYKLEMKYLACQEQCKKLKIELAKALSKNKELLQDIDGKKENNELKQNNSNLSELKARKENANGVESQKVSLNENKVLSQQENVTNEGTREKREEISCDIKNVSSFDKADFKKTDSVNEMEVELDNNSCNVQREKLIKSNQVPQECTNIAKEECVEEDIDCDLQQEMEVDEDRRESKDSKDPCNVENSSDFQIKEKDHIESKTNPNVDVFTMVRASVLKNLYLTIEDLTEEKKQLQNNLEEYQKLDSNIVPSFEDCEDSL